MKVPSYFVYTQPFRRWLLKLSSHLPRRAGDWLCNQMYPDDMVLRFRE